MEAIGYEWGAPSYLEAISPDDAAQNALASRFSWYGGSFNDPKSQGGQTYQYGDMNGMVYPVQVEWKIGPTLLHGISLRLNLVFHQHMVDTIRTRPFTTTAR